MRRHWPASHEPPLQTREVATWLGCHIDTVRRAILRGVVAPDGARVRLPAERVRSGLRRTAYRVHTDEFRRWLKRIGWRRLPHASSDAGSSAR